MWLAAENGMFLRATKGQWMTTMPEHLNMEWVESVKVTLKINLYSVSRYPDSPGLHTLLMVCFSMSLNISQREHPGHTLNFVKLPSFGITNMQVLASIFNPFLSCPE